jgi:hypothetical protein
MRGASDEGGKQIVLQGLKGRAADEPQRGGRFGRRRTGREQPAHYPTRHGIPHDTVLL